MTLPFKRTNDTEAGRSLWGFMPLPSGAEIIGTITRPGETWGGALIRMASGQLVQGNAGAVRTLNAADVPGAGQ